MKKQNAELKSEIKLRDEFIENLLSFEDSIGDNWFFYQRKATEIMSYRTAKEAFKAYKEQKDESNQHSI